MHKTKSNCNQTIGTQWWLWAKFKIFHSDIVDCYYLSIIQWRALELEYENLFLWFNQCIQHTKEHLHCPPLWHQQIEQCSWIKVSFIPPKVHQKMIYWCIASTALSLPCRNALNVFNALCHFAIIPKVHSFKCGDQLHWTQKVQHCIVLCWPWTHQTILLQWMCKFTTLLSSTSLSMMMSSHGCVDWATIDEDFQNKNPMAHSLKPLRHFLYQHWYSPCVVLGLQSCMQTCMQHW